MEAREGWMTRRQVAAARQIVAVAVADLEASFGTARTAALLSLVAALGAELADDQAQLERARAILGEQLARGR